MPAPGTGKKLLIGLVASAVLSLSLYVLYAGGGIAPLPPAFDRSVTLEYAQKSAQATDKPVLVFVSADWCGACQRFKRKALASQLVTQQIRKDYVPVYLDATEANREAMSLRVVGVPTLLVLRGGLEVSRLTGGVGEGELIQWLDKSLTMKP